MNKGDEVCIYLDPLTEKQLEGKALLVKHHHGVDEPKQAGGQMQFWSVEFLDDDDGNQTCRWVFHHTEKREGNASQNRSRDKDY